MINLMKACVLGGCAALLFGCSTKDEDAVAFHMLASEQTLPDNFEEVALERPASPNFQLLIKHAAHEAAFEENWAMYELAQPMPNVNFDEKGVLFIGMHESGSCESEIERMEFESDENRLVVPISVPDGACTTDAVPRTFVLELEQSLFEKIEAVTIVEGSAETNVPID